MPEPQQRGIWAVSATYTTARQRQQQHRILNPLSEVRNWTRILLVPSWIRLHCAMTGTLQIAFNDGYLFGLFFWQIRENMISLIYYPPRFKKKKKKKKVGVPGIFQALREAFYIILMELSLPVRKAYLTNEGNEAPLLLYCYLNWLWSRD